MTDLSIENAFDVAVVGSGPAGCSTAILYAQKGLKVALIERFKDAESFKPVCTHFLQGCATPILKKMDVCSEIEGIGAIKNHINIWTKYGWIRPEKSASSDHHGYNIRRQSLDPIMRNKAVNHENVTMFQGWKMHDLVFVSPKRVSGVVIVDAVKGKELRLSVKLVVGADGRTSKVSSLVNSRISEKQNNRTFFVSYYKNLNLKTGLTSQLWLRKKDVAYAFPCDGGLTLLCLGMHKDNIKEFSSNTEQVFHDYFKALPDAPDMDAAERVAKVTQGKNMHTRRASYDVDGVALVGDSLLAVDPYAGTGIAWAIQGADWLVDSTAEVIKNGTHMELNRALRKYNKIHIKKLKWHTWMISDYSSGRDFNFAFPPERLIFSAAVNNVKIANQLDLFLNRVVGFEILLSPSLVLSAVVSSLKGWIQRTFTINETVNTDIVK